MRRAGKVDANQGAVVAALRAVGVAVHITSDLGGGFVDIVAHKPGHPIRLIEIKDGAKVPSKRKLTAAECAFHRDFPVDIIESVPQALALFGIFGVTP